MGEFEQEKGIVDIEKTPQKKPAEAPKNAPDKDESRKKQQENTKACVKRIFLITLANLPVKLLKIPPRIQKHLQMPLAHSQLPIMNLLKYQNPRKIPLTWANRQTYTWPSASTKTSSI